MRLAALVLVLLLSPALATGCGRQRWLEVASGDYDQVRGAGDAGRAAAREVRRLTVDRQAGAVTVALDDGSALTWAFVAREREGWPIGCPTNLFEHRMEVLDLDVDAVTIGALTLQSPILVRNCPREPDRVILRAGGSITEGINAADGVYLVFTR